MRTANRSYALLGHGQSGDHGALELIVVGQIPEQHPPGGAVGVDQAADRQQVMVLVEEVVADERTDVAQRAGQAVQLRDDQRVGVTAPDHAQRRLQAGPLQRATQDPLVCYDIDQSNAV